MCEWISSWSRFAGLVFAACVPALACHQSIATMPSPQGGGSVAITHVTILDVERGRSLPDMSVLIDSGRILEVVHSNRFHPPARTRAFDARNRYLMPGLWDMHVHLTTEGEWALPEYLAHGITGLRDMGGDEAKIKEMKRRIAHGDVAGPRIVSSGPMIESPDALKGILAHATAEDSIMATRDRVVVSSAAQAAAVVDSIASLGVDMIKARDFADVATYWAIAGSARRVGLPFVGHAPFGLSVDAIALADSGQNDLEHWYFPTDLPTLPAAQYEKIVTEYVRNGTALAPTLTAWRQHRFTVDSLEKLLAAANRDPRAVRAPASLFRHWKSQLDPRRTENKGKPYTAQQLAGWNRVLDEYARETGKLARKGMMILAGSDLPFARYPGEGLQDELVALVNEAGVTPAQALQTATVIPARFLKLESVGKIEPGMDADLVVLDANPFVDITNIRRVRAVMQGGRWAPPGIVKGRGAR